MYAVKVSLSSSDAVLPLALMSLLAPTISELHAISEYVHSGIDAADSHALVGFVRDRVVRFSDLLDTIPRAAWDSKFVYDADEAENLRLMENIRYSAERFQTFIHIIENDAVLIRAVARQFAPDALDRFELSAAAALAHLQDFRSFLLLCLEDDDPSIEAKFALPDFGDMPPAGSVSFDF
jgi:hypothetical protein